MSPEDDDLVAAEYVLGTLDPDERDAAARRRDDDPLFAGKVTAWEHRLSPLSEAGVDSDVPDYLWPAVMRRLGWSGPTLIAGTDRTAIRLTRSVRRWRWATAGMTALAAALAGLVVTGAIRERQNRGPQLVAFLQRTDDAPAFVVKADLRDNTLAVRPVAAHVPDGRSYELWIIDPSLGSPRALGLLNADTGSYPLPSGATADVLRRATYAVTDEPAGGSTDGKPSGAPVYLGHLVPSGP